MNLTIKGLRPLSFSPLPNPESLWGQNLEFSQGEVVLVSASSGRGKSTLVQSLMGLRSDYEGKIEWDGHVLDSPQAAYHRRFHWGYVPQTLGLFDDLSLEENLYMKLGLMGLSLQDLDPFWEGALEISGLKPRWKQKAGTLSQGEKQRASLLRALCAPFQWLILDEPFSHLDLNNSTLFWKLCLERCQNWGAGMLITSLDGQLPPGGPQSVRRVDL